MISLLRRALVLLALAATAHAAPPENPGVAIAYQLPVDGPLPRTYRVTLAITDPAQPGSILSEFASGLVRTVTAANQGKFTERWNGLDDNFMPLPPGTYGVKGIYMPAQQWPVDGQFHTITPRFVTGASSWLPSPDEAARSPLPFGGDPCDAPLTSVAVGPNGHAVFYYGYLENDRNNPVFDLNQPIGPAQFLHSYPSGGAAGGDVTATDGTLVWSLAHEGCPDAVYRADGLPFGTGRAHRDHVFLPAGKVTAMAACHDDRAAKSYLCLTQRGRLISTPTEPIESTTDFIDQVTFLDGDNGALLAQRNLRRPQALAIHNQVLYALHLTKSATWEIVSVPLEAGRPHGPWQKVFTVPPTIHPFDLALDSHANFYLSDPAANHVYRLNTAGKILNQLGARDAQIPGAYDPATMMSPGKMAVWTDPSGRDHLLVVEQAGPNRVAEWSPDGTLLRDFLTYQTKANHGYTLDPDNPSELYIAGQQNWLVRFHLDFPRRAWTVDAVWPIDPVPHQGFDFLGDPRQAQLQHPRLLRVNGREYLACARSFTLYRHDGDRWLLSAAFLRRNGKDFAWHDANGNGRLDPAEITPLPSPSGAIVFRYHGEQFLDDLSLVSPALGGRSVDRLAVEGFDSHGNPIYKRWQPLLTDPVFELRTKNVERGTEDTEGRQRDVDVLLSRLNVLSSAPVNGGNELDDNYSSDWAEATGSLAAGFYVVARGGKSPSANNGAQDKISRYVPDAHGGYRLQWRTGRQAFGPAAPGELIAAIHLHAPINGLLAVIDQSRCGILLYTADGLYVDTLFPDGQVTDPATAGLYDLPGEFFAGDLIPDKTTGTIYALLGKETPMLYAMDGWTTTLNPVRPLDTLPKEITLRAADIAAPPPIALALRGGAGSAPVARFTPALGGAVLDGSMTGWTAAAPIVFQSDAQHTVEVRGLYDPEHLYLRWHARLGAPFHPRPLAPLERIFTHDRRADTLSLYLQGDPNAAPPANSDGRPGDARLVFGLFRDGAQLKPAVLGLYPTWPSTPATPQTYGTAAGGHITFAQAGPVPGVELHATLDPDQRGFVLTAAIPHAAFPGLPTFGPDLHTMVDFEATFAGHDKFWWANSDGSASRETYDEPTEARLYPGAWAPLGFTGLGDGILLRDWLVVGPFGGPGAEKFKRDPAVAGGDATPVRRFFDPAVYPPEHGPVDPRAVFRGPALRGYWPDPHEERWTPATVPDLATRLTFGDGAQMWYAATWVHAPADTTLDFRFQGQVQAFLTWSLNGKVVQHGEIEGPNRVATKPLTLHQGWNEILLKAYCIGSPPLHAGLILAGPPEKLWPLQLSGTPP